VARLISRSPPRGGPLRSGCGAGWRRGSRSESQTETVGSRRSKAARRVSPQGRRRRRAPHPPWRAAPSPSFPSRAIPFPPALPRSPPRQCPAAATETHVRFRGVHPHPTPPFPQPAERNTPPNGIRHKVHLQVVHRPQSRAAGAVGHGACARAAVAVERGRARPG